MIGSKDGAPEAGTRSGPSRRRPLLIDARAQLDGLPIALATAHERPLLEHLLRYVLSAGDGRVDVVAEPEQVDAIRARVEDLHRRMNFTCRVEVSAQPPSRDAVRLRADTVYDLPRLRRILRAGGDPRREALWRITDHQGIARAGAEIARAVDWYPLSRWYLRPAARRLARTCGLRGVTANGLTWAGFFLAVAAILSMPLATDGDHGLQPWVRLGVAGLLLGYWLLDQADGYLARLTGSTSAYGGWLDANLDELADLGLHVAAGAALTVHTASVAPLWLVVGFLCGKYLFVYGLNPSGLESEPPPPGGGGSGGGGEESRGARRSALLRRLWHLPADADVRLHLLAVAVACGVVEIELALVAGYYNLRWVARHVLVARRAKRPT